MEGESRRKEMDFQGDCGVETDDSGWPLVDDSVTHNVQDCKPQGWYKVIWG